MKVCIVSLKKKNNVSFFNQIPFCLAQPSNECNVYIHKYITQVKIVTHRTNRSIIQISLTTVGVDSPMRISNRFDSSGGF